MTLKYEIAQEEARLLFAESQIQRLEQECTLMRANLVCMRYACSIISRLPLELLGEVFIHCLPSLVNHAEEIGHEALCGRRLRARSHCAPLVLLRVCKTWNALCRSTPQLWSTHASNFAISGACSQAELLGLTHALSHCPHAPLTLVLGFNSLGQFVPDGLLPLLRALCVRFKDLCLANPSTGIVEFLLHDTRLPLLERCHVISYYDGPREWWEGHSALVNAPRLVDIEINWASIDMKVLALPWARLTRLVLHNSMVDGERPITWQDFLNVLARCPALVTYSISPHGGGSAAARTMITAPALMELCIETMLDCNKVLECMVLPSLAVLSLGNGYPDGSAMPWPGDALTSLLKRSACDITDLTLDHVAAPSESALSYLLREVPHLRTLELIEHDEDHALISENLMRALATVSGDEMSLLPDLAVLELYDYRTLSAADLADVAEARGWVDNGGRRGQLRRLVCDMIVPSDWEPWEPGRARLQACQDAGLAMQCRWRIRAEYGELEVAASLPADRFEDDNEQK